MSDLWQKAVASADDARFLLAAGRREGACNRAYYAVFNAARALLTERGISIDRAKRHATVVQQFSLHFVQTGLFTSLDGRALAEAGQLRNQADYSSEGVSEAAAADVMASLERFMTLAASYLEADMPKAGDRSDD